MKTAKLFITTVILSLLVITQFVLVSAAPSYDEADFVSGAPSSISLVKNESGPALVEITLTCENGNQQTYRVTEDTAYSLGLLAYGDGGDGSLVPVEAASWPKTITIPLEKILPAEEQVHHPVGNALATYFSDIPGVDYNAIMTAREYGYGFGAIAQALWLTQKMGGDVDTLTAILEAKKTGDYSAFTLEDGTVPSNWGQFKKAILDGEKKTNLGVIMSGKDKDKDKPGNNGNGSDNGNNKDKDKDKVKDKDKDKNNNVNDGNNGNSENSANNGNNGNNGNPGNNGNKDNNGKNKS